MANPGDRDGDLPRFAWLAVALVALIGVVMASPWFARWADSWAPYSRVASREIGAALVGGAVVGGALIWVDARIEYRRRQADEMSLAARDREQLFLLLRRHQDHRSIDVGGDDLAGMRLRRKNFAGGYFVGTRLARADLSLCSLTRANVAHADLSDAVLDGADLNHANLDGADLSRASLRGVVISPGSFRGVSLRGATIGNVNIAGVDFTNADFTGASLIDVHFRESDFTGAIFDDLLADEQTKEHNPNMLAIQSAGLIPYQPQPYFEAPVSDT